MPFIYLDQVDPTRILNCTKDDEGGGVEITKEQAKPLKSVGNFKLVRFVNGEIVDSQEGQDEVTEDKRIAGLQSEFDSLQSAFAAKGLVWLIKRKILDPNDPLTKADLPAAMVAAYNRMEEIETEWNP